MKHLVLVLALAISACGVTARAQPTATTIRPGSFGDKHWKPPVANEAALPLTGNSVADTRRVIDTGDEYWWNGGAWVNAATAGPQGAPGADGATWTSGASVPSPGAGADGDYYFRTSTADVYSKSAGSWSIIANIRGSAGQDGSPGEPGAPGSSGAAGADGKTVRSGSGAPSSGLGVDGDFYLDTSATAIYGPKTAGGWGNGVSLVGPQGATGPTGATGAAGAPGATGAAGSAGAAATIAVGTVSTSAPGSTAAVTNAGSSSAAVFDFAIPRGDVGATGSTGATGAAGSDGIPRTIADEGTSLTQQTTLNFIGAPVTCVNNAGASRTDCTVAAVAGPSSSTANAVATYSGTSGSVLNDNPGVTIPSTGKLLLSGTIGLTAFDSTHATIQTGSDRNSEQSVRIVRGDQEASAGLVAHSIQLGGIGATSTTDHMLFFDGARNELTMTGLLGFAAGIAPFANADVAVTRLSAGYLSIDDGRTQNGLGTVRAKSVRIMPATSPPVTCAAGTEGAQYYDSSHALCVCGASAWINLTPGDGGSCS